MVMEALDCQFEYSAFISYRHQDNAAPGRQWATWLHNALEQFEVPPDLAGCLGRHGEAVSGSLFPVFRDEDELPASADLGERIEDALRKSRNLIVICSPRAVESRHVAAEIRYFKELGRSNRIFALIIDGDPATGSLNECFPESLRSGKPGKDGRPDWSAPAEPIAADARLEGKPQEGWTSIAALRCYLESQNLGGDEITRLCTAYEKRLQTALLKIIAGTLGVSLRDLTKRDKARQLHLARQRAKRLAWVSGGFFVLSLLAIGGGVFAWKKKQMEQRQRAAAEELVQHIVFDLHEKLAPMRRTDLLEAAAVGVSRYFERFPESSRRPEAHRQRAALLSNLGYLQTIQNRLRDAAQSHRTALELRRQLYAADPQAPDSRHELWSSLNSLGILYSQLQQLDLAEAFHNEAMQFAGTDPFDTAASIDGMAQIAIERKKTEEALSLHRKALDLREKIPATEPLEIDRLNALARSHNHLGDVFLVKGDAENAALHFNLAYDIRLKLDASGPGNADERRDLSIALNKLGTLQQKRGNISAAEVTFRNALAIRRQLAKDDPDGSKTLRDLAASLHKLGDALAARLQFEESLAAFDEALKIRNLMAAHPQAGPDVRRVLCFNLDAMGEVHSALGNHREAHSLHARSLETSRSIFEALPGNTDSRRNFAISLCRVGAAELALGNPEKAADLLQQSVEHLREIAEADKDNADDQRYLCESLEIAFDIHFEKGNAARAQEAIQRALNLREDLSATSGGDAPSLASCLGRASAFALLVGDEEKAASLFKRARELLETPFSAQPDDPAALSRFYDWLGKGARFCELAGKWEAAIDIRLSQLQAARTGQAAKNPWLEREPGNSKFAAETLKLVTSLVALGRLTDALSAVTAVECTGMEADAARFIALYFNQRMDEARRISASKKDDFTKWTALLDEQAGLLESRGAAADSVSLKHEIARKRP